MNYHQNRNTPTQQVTRGKYNAERNYRSNKNSRYHNKKKQKDGHDTSNLHQPDFRHPSNNTILDKDQDHSSIGCSRKLFVQFLLKVKAQIEQPPHYNNERQNYFLPQPYGLNHPPSRPLMRYHDHQRHQCNQSFYQPSIQRL